MPLEETPFATPRKCKAITYDHGVIQGQRMPSCEDMSMAPDCLSSASQSLQERSRLSQTISQQTGLFQKKLLPHFHPQRRSQGWNETLRNKTDLSHIHTAECRPFTLLPLLQINNFIFQAVSLALFISTNDSLFHHIINHFPTHRV